MKMRTFKTHLLTIFATLAIGLAVPAVALAKNPPRSPQSSAQITRQVRHELVTLPYYGVFDNLSYQVSGSTVTLYGQVTHPSTRSEAAARVSRINGVTRVVNNIQVLPLSSFDDSIRRQVYRSVFSTSGLYRYAMGANPSIHIIVNGGRVTLEGVVSSNMDRQLAYMAASRVPGVFSVTNNLRLENEIPR
jgi:hyperosmotically inducible periplasmic protein